MEVYVNPRINADVFLKNPMDSELGKKIISYSVKMIDEIGFSKFNFKKLAEEIQSTEASIYRYFPNKHRVIIYLSAWYWEFVLYQINVKTKEVKEPKKRLEIAIKNLVYIGEEAQTHSYLDMVILQRIITEQFYKIVRTKNVSVQNESGFFESYKRLCSSLASLFNEIDSSFKYPMTMSTAVVEMSINNTYCCSNMPSLTEIKCGADQKSQIEMMIQYFCGRLLEKCQLSFN